MTCPDLDLEPQVSSSEHPNPAQVNLPRDARSSIARAVAEPDSPPIGAGSLEVPPQTPSAELPKAWTDNKPLIGVGRTKDTQPVHNHTERPLPFPGFTKPAIRPGVRLADDPRHFPIEGSSIKKIPSWP